MRSSRFCTPATVAAATLLVVAACGSSDDEPSSATETTPVPQTTEPVEATPYGQFRAAPTACGADRPDPVTPMTFEMPEDQGLDPESKLQATISTSCGDITVELDPGGAPLAVNSFVFLARQGYYDGTVAHRIRPGFMFQAGDQTAAGGGDPGYRLPVDEYPDADFTYERGVVAMANGGPGTTGSQFFIMFEASGLSPNYTVIGRVVAGDDVLDDIAAIPITDNGRGEKSLPLEALYIEEITIEE